MDNYELNMELTKFLDSKRHPLRDEIEYLWSLIMSTELGLVEGIK